MEIPAWFNITPDREDLLRIFKLGLPPSGRQTSPLKDQLRLIRHLYPKKDKVTSLKKESLAIFFLKYGDLLYEEDKFELALVEYEKAKDIVSQHYTDAKLLYDEISSKIKKIIDTNSKQDETNIMSENIPLNEEENELNTFFPQQTEEEEKPGEQLKQNPNPTSNEDKREKYLESEINSQTSPQKPKRNQQTYDNKKLIFQLKFEHLIVLMLPLYIILIILVYLLYEQNNSQDKIQPINQQEYKQLNEQEYKKIKEKEHQYLITSAIKFGKDNKVNQGLELLCKIPSNSDSFADAKSWIKKWLKDDYWGKELPSILEGIKEQGLSCPAAEEVYPENINLIKE